MLMHGGGRQCLFYHLILCYHTPSSRNTLLNKKEKKNFRGLLDTQLVFFVFFFFCFLYFFSRAEEDVVSGCFLRLYGVIAHFRML